MIRSFLTLVLLINFVFAQGQSVSDLEKKLRSTSDEVAKMELYYELARAYLKKDNDKSSSNAGKAQSIAVNLGDYTMISKAAYVGGMAHYNRRKYGAATSRFKQGADAAAKAKNLKYGLACYEKLESIEKDKKKNLRGAYSYSQQAKKFLESLVGYGSSSSVSSSSSSSGGSSSALKKQNADLNKKLQELEREKIQLQREIRKYASNEEQFLTDKDQISKKQKQLDEERQNIEKSISEKDELLATSAEQKAAVEEKIKRKERELSKLSKREQANKMILQEQSLKLAESELQQEQSRSTRNLLFLISGFLVALTGLFYSRFRANKKAKQKLEEKNEEIELEKERSDELLLNILPANIAMELKEHGKAKAEKYFNSTVLFSDFKNFTKISEQLTPEKLVEELDYCFKAFDYIISQYKIEKIKTIGDAYMCAMGLSSREEVPNDIVKAALEMQEFLDDYKKEKILKGEPYFEARIGIHTGPVVAGVVGVNKFAYDIWGDTVNIASRMEANCEVGKVNISESTYRQVKYGFNCIPRGKIAAKNKGEIEMFYVLSTT